MPFASLWERDIHYAKHGHEFGAAHPAEYEWLADAFMYGAMPATTRGCTRPRTMDRIRFDFGSYHEGVARTAPAVLKTFSIVRNNWFFGKPPEDWNASRQLAPSDVHSPRT
jgi:hypothetical protein